MGSVRLAAALAIATAMVNAAPPPPEVTQQEWRTVMGTAPSYFSGCGPRCPVENVSFGEVQQFLAKLNAHIGPPQSPPLRFRLPTEAEWEYACRGEL